MRKVGTLKSIKSKSDADVAPPVKRGPGRPRLLEPSPEFLSRMDEIVAAAADVFHEKGYDAGTLDDVAEALDLRKATLYYYVKSKSNLLYMVFTRALDVGLASVADYSKIEDPAERLEALIRHQVRMVAEAPTLFSVFYDSRFRLDDRYKTEVRQRAQRYDAVFASAVEAAAAAGVIGDVNPRYATAVILGMANWSYKWFKPGTDSVSELEDTCVNLIMCRVPASERASKRQTSSVNGRRRTARSQIK